MWIDNDSLFRGILISVQMLSFVDVTSHLASQINNHVILSLADQSPGMKKLIAMRPVRVTSTTNLFQTGCKSFTIASKIRKLSDRAAQKASEVMSFNRMSVKMNRVRDAAPKIEPKSGLKFHQFFSAPYKFILACQGISFQKSTLINRLVLSILVLRALINLTAIFASSGLADYDLFSIVVTVTVYASSAVIGILLFTRVNKFNALMDTFYRINRIQVNESNTLVSCIRKLNIVSVLIISTEYFCHLAMGFVVHADSNNWVVKQFMPIKSGVNPNVRLIIAYGLFAFDALAMCFVPITMSLYQCFYYSLNHLKTEALNMIGTRQLGDLANFVFSLDEMMDTFESFFSFIPFSYLLYCGGPNLCFILTTHDSQVGKDDERTSALIFIAISYFNIFLVLSSLFICSLWQDKVDQKVASINRNIALTGEPRLTFQLQQILNVLRRRPTVWFIFSIDRQLILSCIGSAITFSTLFIQLGKQK